MFRSTFRQLAAGAILTALVACVYARPRFSPAAAPDLAQGYVAGRFESIHGSHFGFVLYDVRDVEYRVTFGEGVGFMRTSNDPGTGLTPLPPGDYRVGAWTTGHLIHRLSRDSPLGRPFRLEPGHVVFLGSFDAYTQRGTYEVVWTIQARRLGADEVMEVVRNAYPAFGEAPVECVLCNAPAKDGAVSAEPPMPPSPLLGKKTTVLHFHRRAGKYDAWGLHAWESFQEAAEVRSAAARPDNRVLAGVTWDQPLAADGTDDFGAYWALADANFRNGRVNFTLHAGAASEMPGRFWIVEDSREAWVNEGDPKVYLSREEAEASRNR